MNSVVSDAERNFTALAQNPYPGRGLIVGLHQDGLHQVQIYWIMGRSDNSRNRVFSEDGERVFTEAADPAKVKDPSLIIYNAMVELPGDFSVVSNGAQTSEVAVAMSGGDKFVAALADWQYEPDAPNFTPRITAVTRVGDDDPESPRIEIAILRNENGGCTRTFYEMRELVPGIGYCVTTYTGDGNPLPSFAGPPYEMPLCGTIDQLASAYWAALNEANRVSLVVKFIPVDGSPSAVKIVNQYTKV